jgi:hypothetical protein
MNGQLLDLWGRWMTAALQGTHQMDLMTGWWQRSVQSMSPSKQIDASPWLQPMNAICNTNMLNGLQQVWEPLFSMQKLTLQLIGMVPREKYTALAEHAEDLERKVQEQARTIDRLQELLRQTGSENNVVVAQLQDLIEQQSKQFKQLTKSVGSYIKDSAKELSQK